MIRAACGELRTRFDRLDINVRTHQSANMNPVLTITTANTHNLTRRRQTGKRARSGVTTLEIGQVTRPPSRLTFEAPGRAGGGAAVGRWFSRQQNYRMMSRKDRTIFEQQNYMEIKLEMRSSYYASVVHYRLQVTCRGCMNCDHDEKWPHDTWPRFRGTKCDHDDKWQTNTFAEA